MARSVAIVGAMMGLLFYNDAHGRCRPARPRPAGPRRARRALADGCGRVVPAGQCGGAGGRPRSHRLLAAARCQHDTTFRYLGAARSAGAAAAYRTFCQRHCPLAAAGTIHPARGHACDTVARSSGRPRRGLRGADIVGGNPCRRNSARRGERAGADLCSHGPLQREARLERRHSCRNRFLRHPRHVGARGVARPALRRAGAGRCRGDPHAGRPLLCWHASSRVSF